jgi:hypothetical protein
MFRAMASTIPQAMLDMFRHLMSRGLRDQETTSPRTDVLIGGTVPVGGDVGALSDGVPMLRAHVRVVDERGKPSPAGQLGQRVEDDYPVFTGQVLDGVRTAVVMRATASRKTASRIALLPTRR